MNFNKSNHIDIEVTGTKSVKEMHSDLIGVEHNSRSNSSFIIYRNHLSNYITMLANKIAHLKEKESEDVETSIQSILDKITIENFICHFVNIEKSEKNRYSCFYLDNYFFEDNTHEVDNFIKDSHESLISFEKELTEYQYENKDPFYYYGHSNHNKDNILKVANIFRKNIFKELSSKEEFSKCVFNFLAKFQKELLSDMPKFEFDESKEIYILPKEIDTEYVLKTSEFPSVKVLYLVKCELKEIGRYSYLFTDDKHFSRKEFSFNEYYDLKITVYSNNRTYVKHPNKFHTQGADFYYNKDVILFTSKKEAENYYKKKLRDIRNKIDNLLKEPAIF